MEHRLTRLLAVLLLIFAGAASAESSLQLDRRNVDAMPDNLRFLTAGQYSLGSNPPSAEGMDTLNISGSGQYSVGQFQRLADEIRRLAPGKRVVIVDCRQESHAFLIGRATDGSVWDGSAVSIYAPDNAVNGHLETLEEVRAEEEEHFNELIGETVILNSSRPGWTAYGEKKAWSKRVLVTDYFTEEDLVVDEGFEYLRLVSTDYHWPRPGLIDDFIGFANDPEIMNNAWLHFHCMAGVGRTAVFMCIYDMMKNPGVALEDITARQARLGAENLLNAHHNAKAKNDMIRLVYRYIREQQALDEPYAETWSDWIAGLEEAETAPVPRLRLRPGQRIRIPGEAEPVSSDQSVLRTEGDTLIAETAGRSMIRMAAPDTGAQTWLMAEVSESFPVLTLPSALTSLGNAAFAGADGIAAVEIGPQTAHIGAGALRIGGDLQVTVLSDGTEFDEDAFGSGARPLFLCHEGSAAETFAAEHGYPVLCILP